MVWLNIQFGICLKIKMGTFGLEHETVDYIATMDKHLKLFRNKNPSGIWKTFQNTNVFMS